MRSTLGSLLRVRFGGLATAAGRPGDAFNSETTAPSPIAAAHLPGSTLPNHPDPA
jgi:hypothetical protein